VADRLSNETELYESVVKNGLDKVDALKLNHDNKSHPKTFTFAMALGASTGIRKPTKKRTAWLQYSAINNSDTENSSYAASVALKDLRENGEDNLITNDDDVFGIASEYANTGFEMIREMVPDFDKYDEDDFIQQLIALMDEKYEEIIEAKIE